MNNTKTLRPFYNGAYHTSASDKYMKVHNPSTGEVLALAPCCTKEEVYAAIESAAAAYPIWKETPVGKRIKIVYRVRELLIKHLEELTDSVARENGKSWSEAEGDVLKAIEATEQACSADVLMQGDALMNVSNGIDTTLYREPLGVFAGIAPFNFPAMIPMGWMAPMCIATGNTIVLKAASITPMTALRIAEIYKEAGLPDGVLNVLTCSRQESELFLSHPDIKGITLVGSTTVGEYIYEQAAKNGKRVQCLTEAKNHALVLRDAPIRRTAASIINSAFGCAGERCMALPVIVVENAIADKLIEQIVELCKKEKIGPAYEKETNLGPLITAEHKESVVRCIEKGVAEGAELILDGRDISVKGYENGFYLGHTIFDKVTPEMSIGNEEIFGPVLCIKRVNSFEEGLEIMNNNPFANGSVIFTQNGYYAREFARRTDGGMVGVNVGIPVPVGSFPFCGHKRSFFGDLHCLGKDGMRFFTESKCVTTKWFDEEEMKIERVSTWDGTI